VALYDVRGALIASTSPHLPRRWAGMSRSTVIDQERNAADGGHSVIAATAFVLSGERAGTVAVSIPASAQPSIRGAAFRVALFVGAAMLVAAGVGLLVSRLVVRQLSVLVETSRALGAGHLEARAPELSDDEHGELAVVLNTMAEQLGAQRASLELQVEQRTAEIRRLMQRRSEFFAGLSHELRTPLAVIATEAEMLGDTERAGDPVGAAHAAAAAIAESTRQLTAMVDDILDLARAEAGTVDVALLPVDLAAVVGELDPLLRRLGAAAEVEVSLTLGDGPMVVLADRDRVRDVLVNLSSNAIKYTPSGGAVHIAVSCGEDRAEVRVEDTGIGIASDVGDRVFDPFYRVPGSAPQHGEASSGLGLALARQWVEAMAGSVWWESRRTGGTSFVVSLPLAMQDAGRPATAPRAGANARTA
jgi:signal transduction histidine kinase